jgi:ureidoacrylate peracid hydrolase
MVKDATASYSDTEMRTAGEVHIPNYATAVLLANEVVDAISS